MRVVVGPEDITKKRRGANWDIFRQYISKRVNCGLLIRIQSLSGTRRLCWGDLPIRKDLRLGQRYIKRTRKWEKTYLWPKRRLLGPYLCSLSYGAASVPAPSVLVPSCPVMVVVVAVGGAMGLVMNVDDSDKQLVEVVNDDKYVMWFGRQQRPLIDTSSYYRSFVDHDSEESA